MTRDPVRLARATLDLLPAGVARPAHDPTVLKAGIVHLGLGGFDRAHMARDLDDPAGIDPAARD